MTAGTCTIVIPAYNAAPYLQEALESLRTQACTPHEVIVVDDGSTDNTAEIAAAFEGVRLLQQANRGVAAARNAGLAIASGELILFLDADDWLMPGAISRHATALSDHPNAVASYGEALRTTGAGQAIGAGDKPVFGPRPSGALLRQLLQYNFIQTSGICMRTEAARAAGGFPEHLRMCEDWAMWCALAAQGEMIYLQAPPVSAYRDTATGASHRLGTSLAETEAAIQHVYSQPAVRALPTHELHILRRRRQAHAHAYAGTLHYKANHWREAARHFWASSRLSPTTLRSWVLLGLALAHSRPRAVEQRLK